jgi:predicted transcriptional regulator
VVAYLFIGWGVFRIVTGGIGAGIWTILIGIFMQGAARNELRVQKMKSVLQTRQIAHLMMHNPRIQRWASPDVNRVLPKEANALAPETNLWAALKEMEKKEVRYMPVMREGQLLGIVQREDIFGYLRVLQSYRGGLGVT